MSFTSGKRVTNAGPCKADADMDTLHANIDDLNTRTAAVVTAGALVSKTSHSITTSSTAVSWTAATFDTSSFWAGGSPTRLTVPNGITYIQLSATLIAASELSNGNFHMEKNGAAFNGEGNMEIDKMKAATISSSIVQVSAGDYFEVKTQVNSGTVSADLTFSVKGWP